MIKREFLHENIRLSKRGTWEWDWLQARQNRWYDENNGWRSRAHARRQLRMKAIDMMLDLGWYKAYEFGWIQLNEFKKQKGLKQ